MNAFWSLRHIVYCYLLYWRDISLLSSYITLFNELFLLFNLVLISLLLTYYCMVLKRFVTLFVVCRIHVVGNQIFVVDDILVDILLVFDIVVTSKLFPETSRLCDLDDDEDVQHL